MNNIHETTFEIAILHGSPVLFPFEHIPHSQVPSDLFRYDIRHADKNPSLPVQLEQNVSDHYYGTVLSKNPIELAIEPKNMSLPACKPISEQDFKIDDYAVATIQQYFDGNFELTPEPEANIRVLIVEPWEMPREEVISNTLQAKQEIVEGMIEAVYPFEDQASLICNDEGKLIGLPLNRRVGGDIIAGTFIICGLDDRNASFCSLNDDQVKRYKEMFSSIEIYMPRNAIPVAESWHKGKKKEIPER